jgi:NAD(P)-dependent dehydrogenase (short-subunit alcohol dehydrogenase family)
VVATELARMGSDIGLCYRRSREEAERTADAVRALGRRAFVRQANLAEAGDCEAFVNESAAALGRLDVLINMASIYVSTPFNRLTVEEFDEAMAIDVRSAFICSRAAWPHMRRNGGGHIINFSDWVARSGRPRYTGYLPYYIAKTAVIGLTEALALELAPDKIRVNAIAPGPIVAPPDTTDEEIATELAAWRADQEAKKSKKLAAPKQTKKPAVVPAPQPGGQKFLTFHSA